jgi:hypothetical protein
LPLNASGKVTKNQLREARAGAQKEPCGSGVGAKAPASQNQPSGRPTALTP